VRTAIWITVAILAAAYVAIALATVDRRPDQAQVNALIERGVEATRERDLTTMVSCISPNYNDGELTYDRLRLILAQALRNETAYTVETSDLSTRIEGDRATVKIHVKLKHVGGATFYDRKILLRLAKEDDRHMLVAPCKTWRVIDAENLGLAMPTPELF